MLALKLDWKSADACRVKGKPMNLLEGLKLMFAAKKLKSAVDKETAKGFDWKINAQKALMNFGIVCGAVAAAAIADYLSIPRNVALLFQWLPESVRSTALGLLAPLIATAAFSLKNWAKNRNNEIVWVVPVESLKPTDRRAGPQVVPGTVPIPISVKPAVPPETVPTIPKDAGA